MKCKKLLSLLLSVVMVGSTVPMAALAAEDDSLAGSETPSGWVDLNDLSSDTSETEATPASDEDGNDTTTGDKTVPGWVDENDGHPKKVAEMFDFVEDNIAYSIVEGGVEVAPWYWQWVHHNCNQGHVQAVHAGSEYSSRTISIPATVSHDGTTYNVVGIGANAFYNANNYSVTMPSDSDAFTYIGEGAFHQSGYGNITIPASVTTIEEDAFRSPDTAPTYTFAEGSKLESIGTRAFMGNETIRSLALPDGLKSLGSCVFSGCDVLTVTIPASVDTINTDTFDEFYDTDKNEGAGNLSFAEGCIFKIEDGILYDDENLIRVLDLQENVVVPEGIKYIGADAFNVYNPGDTSNYDTLKSITLPSSLVSIGEMAFRSCQGLSSITIPENVTELGDSAFLGCTGLSTVVIEGPITEVQNSTFSGCSSLASITLPDTITKIGDSAFNECTALKSITLPDGVREIAYRAFFKCTSLETITIPENVTTIGNQVFGNSKSLKIAVVPNSVTSIGKQAFQNAFAESENVSLVLLCDVPELGEKVLGSTKPTNLSVYYPVSAKQGYVEANLIEETDTNGYALSLAPSTTMALAANAEGTGNTLTLSGVTVPDGMTLTVNSSNEQIATAAFADGTLTVTGVAAGTATITATLSVNGYTVLTDTCEVTVTDTGAVVPAVEEPETTVGGSLSSASEDDKKAATTVAGSVQADNAISNAANQQAAALNSNTTLRDRLISEGSSELSPADTEDVTLYTQTYLAIEATELTKENSVVTSITLNITPMMQVVASTATDSASVDLTETTGNAVVVQDPEALTINSPAEITVDLPDSFVNKPVYVEHQKNGRSYFYSGTADADGNLTFTSQHGFSPFTFSLNNNAAAEITVNGRTVGYSSLQDAVNEAQTGATITLLQGNLSATVNKDLTFKNGASEPITVTINGQKIKIEAGKTYTYDWTYVPPANPNYRITIGDMEGGTVTADPASAKAGTAVTLTPVPDEGYALSSLTVTDRFGDPVALTENADGTYTFPMPNGQVTVDASFVQVEEPVPTEPFTDVDENDWFYDEVVYVYANGLMDGVGDNRFAPNTTTNRAMLATILYRLAGEPDVSGDLPFTDVAAGQWYTDAVLWAAQNDIVNGVGENTFAPGNDLTREQLVTMLYRYAEAEGYDVSAAADLSGYPDAGQVQTYAQKAMSWAVAEGIVEGMDGNLNPAGNATRAQIATILMRFCENVVQ